ncbi:MAG: histidine--tRNA ligase [Candidatus Huberarchaeum crystalense]|uniref:Histidine--tRNA ligase n=1 Tax=Huberarchaeum crystalense TaxID=2014257 RepID=A0A2H9RDC1_HUBC1|nr:MAG: histidine--tRNA ligase [Candidatus Huberarchaeum crystalense]
MGKIVLSEKKTRSGKIVFQNIFHKRLKMEKSENNDFCTTQSFEKNQRLQQLKGTPEYLPEEQIVREKIIDILKKNFKIYGFKPIETSILEYYNVAANKYAGGEEILKEIYNLKDQGARELCLRYELTFKLAKLFGLNPNLRLPFKRYEIGKVFRDGPIKPGRLREFTQCDVDVVGIKSVIADAELISLIFSVFDELCLPIFVQISDKNFLFGLFEFCGVGSEKFAGVALSLDKLEKFGEEYVKKELFEKEISENVVNTLFLLLKTANTKQTNKDKLIFFKEKLNNTLAQKGLEDLQNFFKYCSYFGINKDIIFTPTLARGLGYYTGFVCEVFLKNSKIKSSISAGGRWDKMISKFLQSEREYPATGLTFGLDVIFTALKEKGLKIFINSKDKIPKILIISINTQKKCLEIATLLRKEGIKCIIEFEKSLKGALDYANKEQIPFALIVGEKELRENKYTLRNLDSKDEKMLSFTEVVKNIKN